MQLAQFNAAWQTLVTQANPMYKFHIQLISDTYCNEAQTMGPVYTSQWPWCRCDCYFSEINPIPPNTGLPSPPQTSSSTVQQYGQDSVIITVQWQPPQYDGGAPVNYTITVSPGVTTVLSSGTSVPVTVPYNVIQTVSIVATNCNGNSSAAIVTIPAIGMIS